MAVRVGVASVHVTHDKESNEKKLLDVVAEAAEEAVEFLILPESALQGYIFGVQHRIEAEEWLYHDRNAETVPGDFTDRLTEVCASRNIIVQCGMTEVSRSLAGALLYDTVVIVGPEGVIGLYRKVHLGGDENHVFQRGNAWKVFDMGFGRVAPFICYDLIFPEAARELTLRGVELLALSTAWPVDNLTGYPTHELDSQLDLFARARALENQVFLACATLTGPDDKSDRTFYGFSHIIGPDGEVVASLRGDEGLVFADLELKEGVRTTRYLGHNGLNFLKDRRPDLYGMGADFNIYYEE